MEQKNVKIKGDYTIVVTSRSPFITDCCENVSIIFAEGMILEQAVPMALSLKGVLPENSYVHVVHKDDVRLFDTMYVSKFMF